MVATRAGERLTPQQKSRVTLSVRSPLVNSLLGGLSIEREYLEELHAFGKRLVADRNRWDIARRKVGLFANRRLSKADAERALSRALATESEVTP